MTACHSCGRIINSTVKGVTIGATRAKFPYPTYCEACAYNRIEYYRHNIEPGMQEEFDKIVEFAQSKIGTHSIDG